MHNKSNEDLKRILENKSDYTFHAVEAVVWELEKRGVLEKGEIALEKPIEETKKDAEKLKESTIENPELYSKTSLFGFTIFFSTIFGAFLLMQNFSRLGYFKARNQVLTFGIVYTFANIILLSVLPPNLLTSFLINVLGYTILSEIFWNRILGKEIKYTKRSIRTHLAISIGIVSLLIIIQLLAFQYLEIPQ